MCMYEETLLNVVVVQNLFNIISFDIILFFNLLCIAWHLHIIHCNGQQSVQLQMVILGAAVVSSVVCTFGIFFLHE